MTTTDSALLVAAVLIGWVGLVAIAMVLRVRVSAPLPAFQFFSRVSERFDALLLSGDLPACTHCGAEAKVLGTTTTSRWFYCACGHYWREDVTGQRPARTSSAAAS